MSSAQSDKPRILNRDKNSVTINWDGLFNIDRNGDTFILQKLDAFKEWQTIYRGGRVEFKVTNLAPCTAYRLRLKLRNQSAWLNFTVVTQTERYFIQHLTRSIQFNKTTLLRKIVNYQVNLLEIPDNKQNNKTALIQAIEKNDANLVELLIKFGVDIDSRSQFKQSSPLMVAIYRGQLQIASLLINKGARIDQVDRNGLNILHYAVDSNNRESVEFCLKQQINVNCKDCNGWTPLIRGCILEIDQKILDLLLENGANPLIKDRNGYDYRKHCQIKYQNCSIQPVIATFL